MKKNVHELKYNDVKKDLEGYFNDFMENPSAFGVKDEELAKAMQGVNGSSKHLMWKQFKKQFNIKMNELALTEAASAFIIDFEQDEDHQLLTHKQLKKILDDPENSDFDLEEGTIAYIQSKDFDREAFIKHVPEMDPDLKSKSQDNSFDMLFLKAIWGKLSPIVDKVVDTLVNLGSTALKKVLDKHVPESLQEDVNATIDVIADTLKGVDEVIANSIFKETKAEVEISGHTEVE